MRASIWFDPLDMFLMFIVGVICGFLVMWMTLLLTESTPVQIDKRWESSLVERGYGKMVIISNNAPARFKWNKP